MTDGKPPRRQVSLRLSIGSAFAAVTVLTAALLGGVTFYSVRDFIRAEIETRLRNEAAMAALRFDCRQHEAVRSRADEGSEAYRRCKLELQRIRDTDTDLRFAYTYRSDSDGKVTFVVDAEEDPAEMSHVGDVYAGATPEMRTAVTGKGAVVTEKSFHTDKWGTWLSAYAPIRCDDGRIDAGLGLDISAARVIGYERRYLLIALTGSLVICAVVLLVGRAFARAIARPLLRLESDMSRIQSLDLSHEIATESWITEVRRMSLAAENMRGGLRSFRRYVPADLVAKLIELRKEAVLEVERRELSVFFSDIRGFTSIAEQLGPERLVAELEPYFDSMTQIIMQAGGTVDKYIGDAIMAFWNAPSPVANHALAACTAALRCQAYVDTLSDNWVSRGLPALHTRIGLCTGDVLVGNVGYAERLNYTAMGDTVNVASRLEGLSKYYGTRLLISASTWQAAGEAVVTRLVGRVAVKGKSEGIDVYELVGLTGEVDPRTLDFVRICNEGMALYRARRWTDAARSFEQACAARPDDTVSRTMLGRAVAFATTPPPPDWDGVDVMHEK